MCEVGRSEKVKRRMTEKTATYCGHFTFLSEKYTLA